jgi:ectoine hydroxylase-related dioxygenase (phytanoyl-CoA dioxygenase family)
MKVIPRTHSNGYSDYEPVDTKTHVFGREIKRHQFDEKDAVALELEPNQASLHNGKLMHSSEANKSSIRRCGYTMRYIPTHVKLNLDKNNMHKIYLARGRDRAGNIYGDPTKCYEELRRYKEKHGNNGH